METIDHSRTKNRRYPLEVGTTAKPAAEHHQLMTERAFSASSRLFD